MAAARISNLECRVVAWGDDLRFRIPKHLAKEAGIDVNTVLSVSAKPGRIVIEIKTGWLSLEAMLLAFDPKRHGGEAMAVRPEGCEVL